VKVLVTGGRGFIGSAVVRRLISHTSHHVINVDRLSYASTEGCVASVADSPRYVFEHADICDADRMAEIFAANKPEVVMHLAAESHVDRSIDGPGEFVRTNLTGTYTLLELARSHSVSLFHHVSTDEVFGSLQLADSSFTESSPYKPQSPYAATKAGADHLVRSWCETYELPTVITNCSNNYGPFHFPEKLIPLMVLRALAGETLPVYGTGANVRDWLHVDDHARALVSVLEDGRAGQTYNVGGNAERSNLEVVQAICDLVDAFGVPLGTGRTRRELIRFVSDRPGHDFRYAVDSSKITAELGWSPTRTFEEGLRETVRWYMANEWWWRPLYEGQATTRRGLAVQQTQRMGASR